MNRYISLLGHCLSVLHTLQLGVTFLISYLYDVLLKIHKTTEKQSNIIDYNSYFSFDAHVVYFSQTAEMIYSFLFPV